MTAGSSLPALQTVERALRETTARLAFECLAPTSNPPQWDEFHWCIARAVATMQGVSPLLSQRLRWQRPHAWRQFLNEQWQHTHDRHKGIAGLIARVDARALSDGMSMLALKGAALHELGIYRPGSRPMADLDVLVRESDAPATCAALRALGYDETRSGRRERTFEPAGAATLAGFGESAANPIKIELHTRIAESLPVRECDITHRLLPQRADPGLHGYDSMHALMLHLLLHAAGNLRTRSVRLIQLNDIAALSARLNAEDWECVLQQDPADRPWWVFPPLTLTARHFPVAIPAWVLTRAEALCPPVLRSVSRRQRLADVSLSHLWIEFCPGIEWCSSPIQVLRYMHARAFPSREQRQEAKTSETTQAWASMSPWSRLSRGRRVMRWLLSRPPRVATMWSVQAAWEQYGMAIAPRTGARA
jgi:hypothetical protein